MSWNASRPRDSEGINEITETMTSNRSGLDSGLRTHFHWSNQTVAAGSVQTSQFTGTARFQYLPRSLVSFPGQEGSGQIVSDESRVGIFLGESFVPIGSKRAIHGLNEGVVDGTTAQILGLPLNTYNLVQSGRADTDASGDVTVTFDQAYDGIPRVLAQASASAPRSEGSYILTTLNSITAADVDFNVVYAGPGADPDEGRIYWRSVGTVTL